MQITSNQIAHFKFSYPKTGQAPDALLTRATEDATKMFLEPSKFVFTASLDTYPDEDVAPEAGLVDVVVMATLLNKKVPWYKSILPHRHTDDSLHMHL